MVSEEELRHFIKSRHIKSFDKVMPHVKEKYPDVTEKQVKDILKSFIKDPARLNSKRYYNKVFSDHPHAWMMDLLDNSGTTPIYNNKYEKEFHEMATKKYPIYWYVFININTRFAAAYPLHNKNATEIIKVLQQFINEHKCVSLTSDKESAFISKQVTNFLTRHNISHYVVLYENHTSMSILDSFIRHLRDMNINTDDSKYQSHHSKYRNFSTKRMKKLLDIYNDTIHSSIGMRPKEMENDIKSERKYIAYCLIQRSKTKDYTIPNGHYVRVILAKELMKKRRYKVSREVYIVDGRDGKNYFVKAQDNTLMSLPRFRLIDLGDTKPDKYKLAETVPEGFRLPESLVENKDDVMIANYGGDNGSEYIRRIDLRRHHPQIKHKLEK